MEICLYQLARPKENVTVKGMGDCTTCITDEDNKKCKRYTPKNITIIKTRRPKCKDY